jgi:c(7)-type cytochrome triheme protein
MSPADVFQRATNISLLQSFGNRLKRKIYQHFVPTGLAVLALCILLFALLHDLKVSASSMTTIDSTPLFDNAVFDPQDQNIDFSRFRHDNKNHARMPCLLCHRRENNEALPSLPGGGGHVPCTGCHAKEFANTSSPVCAICHTNAQSGALKAFPVLKSFNVKFDHSTHTRGLKVSCATCHRPGRGGVTLTIPSGFNAHTTCYQCHAPQAQANGRDISSCSTCHQLGGYSRTPTQTSAFRVGFSHAKHGALQKLTCNECHNVRPGVSQRQQVTTPMGLNHHAPAGATSCMSCHNGKRAFGGDDFAACKRCHTGAAWHF